MRKGFALIFVIILIAALAAAGYFGYQYYLAQKGGDYQAPTQTPVSNYSPVPVVTALPSASPVSTGMPGWKAYTNSQYGFEISYPDNYKALTDAENLYGWPKAVVLLYSGGQSYDLPIEVWNTEAEYKAKYTDLANITVKTAGNKFITLSNMNMDPEVDQIISTFKLTP